MFRAFFIQLFSASLLLQMAACSGPLSTPGVLQPTSTIAATSAPAPTERTDSYQQNVHLFDYAAEAPVAITEETVRQEEGYTVHDIYYPSPREGDVPAYLVVPDGPGPFAGILLMHGSSG